MADRLNCNLGNHRRLQGIELLINRSFQGFQLRWWQLEEHCLEIRARWKRLNLSGKLLPQERGGLFWVLRKHINAKSENQWFSHGGFKLGNRSRILLLKDVNRL